MNQIILFSTFQNMTRRQRITDSPTTVLSTPARRLVHPEGAMHYHQDCAAGFDGFKPPLLPR